MTPNRLTFVNIKSVSLTVGVLLFHLYKNKKGQNLIVLSFIDISYLKIKFYQYQQVLLPYELLSKVQT